MDYNGINILSLDAKDIYISNNYINQDKTNITGYNIRYTKGEYCGNINLKKFINTLDYSIDGLKLREVYEKVYRNRGFSFTEGRHTYTTKVINVTFKYSNKIYNKIQRNVYVKFGYNINDIEFKDNVCIMNNELIAIKVENDVETPINNDVLGDFFYYDDNKYHAKDNITTLDSVSDLRQWVYKNGFYCDGIKYVRFKRSSGSSRVGKCLFIDERLYSRFHKWECCGLSIKEAQDIDLASFEAYIALTLSSIIDTVDINPENILLIDDYKSVFNEDVIETKLNGKNLETKENNITISNSIFDGQSLLDSSIFNDNYKQYGMLLLRNRFFKSCAFNTNLQKWFSDNGITSISQLNGKTFAKDIKDIKMITTPSSIKYLKFGTFENWVKNIDSTFGIVKHEKPTHNFNGRLVQTHYQLINTLQMNEQEMKEFLQPSLDFMRLLRTDSDVLRFYIKYPDEMNYDDMSPLITKNDITYKLLGLNDNFAKTKYYYSFRKDLLSAYAKNIRKGHVLVNGNYSTLFGNPIEMLLQSINKFDGTSQLGIGNIHSKNFKYNTILLGSRSPHVTIGNILLAKNVENKLIDTYFNLSNEIVCINSIGESILDRLSGCDFDSDTMLLTDNKYLINSAMKNYNLFKVPVNHVDSIKVKRKYTKEEMVDLDIKTSNNKIGEIINLSQELNSILWDRMNDGATYNDIKELYYDICQLDVMSCIEIDKAKKEFIVDNYTEMKKIKAKWIKKDNNDKTIKPNFFSYISRYKGFYNPDKKNYLRHKTSMDYLEKVINSYQLSRKDKSDKNDILSFSSIINTDDYDSKLVKYEQIDRIIKLINDSNINIINIKQNELLEKEEKNKLIKDEMQSTIDYICQLKFSKSTMIKFLQICESETNTFIYRNIINYLFGYPNTSFYEVIKSAHKNMPILVKSAQGNIDIYGERYQKIYKNN